MEIMNSRSSQHRKKTSKHNYVNNKDIVDTKGEIKDMWLTLNKPKEFKTIRFLHNMTIDVNMKLLV
jgi:hypothetical protein